MKEPWVWEEADLLALISSKAQESVSLDYKDSRALLNKNAAVELSKDVSAFANSAGGVLVYGISAPDKGDHLPTAIDEGLDPNEPAKEWIDQVIDSNIHRKVEGVRVKQVLLASTRPGRVAYVIYVPQSLRAPHQAADHVFYRRTSYRCVPMEEYEVRDVARRQAVPDLDVELSVRPGAEVEVHLDVSVTNHSDEPALYTLVELLVDKVGAPFGHLGPPHLPFVVEHPPLRLASVGEFHRIRRILNVNSGDLPVFRGVHQMLAGGGHQPPIYLRLARDVAYVGWRAFAPAMQPRGKWYSVDMRIGAPRIEVAPGLGPIL